MKEKMKLALAVAVLTLFSVQGNVAAFVKYDGVKGESRVAKDDKHQKWINLDSVSWSRQPAQLRNGEPGAMQDPAPRQEMGWDNVRNQVNEGDRPIEEVSFYYNKVRTLNPPLERGLTANT